MGIQPIPGMCLFVIYMLFTANLLVAVPENEGISSGLLTVGFFVWTTQPPSRRRTIMLVAAAIAAAGTTITNGLLSAVCLAYDRSRSALRTVLIGFMALAVLAGVTLVLVRISVSVSRFAELFMNGRLADQKATAAIYMASSMLTPAIGPAPGIDIVHGARIVSYEPFDLGRYSWLQAFGAAVWLFLFLVSCVRAIDDERTRVYASVLLSWVTFNALLHNVWGDEFFLYSPHWAWALMAIVVMGVRGVRPVWLAAAAFALVPGQLQTIYEIRNALRAVGL
jgi:hypothetical protein